GGGGGAGRGGVAGKKCGRGVYAPAAPRRLCTGRRYVPAVRCRATRGCVESAAWPSLWISRPPSGATRLRRLARELPASECVCAVRRPESVSVTWKESTSPGVAIVPATESVG